MAFRFPLASVLRVKQSIEEREERALEKIQSEITRVQHLIDQLNGEIATAQRAREEAMQRSMPAGHLHSMLWESHAAAEKKMALLHTLETLEQQRQQQVRIYQAAHRDRETLTGMFDEQREAWELEQARNQQKHLDDIFIARRHLG